MSLSNKVEIDDPDIKGEYDVNYKMISVPVLFRYDLKENMLFVETGPEISFFISSELNADYEELGIPRKETDDIRIELKIIMLAVVSRLDSRLLDGIFP